MSTVIAFRFPAGRYHATPWGSHANEAGVEWPPSPWRILRALVASWHRKLSPEQFPEELLSSLLERLSATDPLFSLPPIVSAHSRHYMPVRASAADRPVLIFDAFARIDPGAELIVAWPGVTLHGAERDLLAALLHATGYLGRAESWTEARLVDDYDAGFNCATAGSEHVPSSRSHQPVKMLAPVTGPAYTEWRGRSISELGLDAKRLTKAQRRMAATLPARLIDALRLDTGDLREAGWNIPPGGKMVTYERPRLESRAQPRSQPRADGPRGITTVRLALAGRPLPRIEDAVRIGELVRIAAISTADRAGSAEGVPIEISGHHDNGDLDHRHAFYLPEDADGDGFIDHVLIHAPGGLSRRAVAAFDDLHRRGLWTRDGERWDVIFEGAWHAPDESRSRYAGHGRTWQSVTPYLHPWFAKARFGMPEQIRRECAQRHLPEIVSLHRLIGIPVGGRERRPVHFHRFRSKRGLRQPDRHGSLLEITFDGQITGPLALGFGCHYGLGMFAAIEE